MTGYYKTMKIPIIQIEEYHWLHFPCSEKIPYYEVIYSQRWLPFQSHNRQICLNQESELIAFLKIMLLSYQHITHKHE